MTTLRIAAERVATVAVLLMLLLLWCATATTTQPSPPTQSRTNNTITSSGITTDAFPSRHIESKSTSPTGIILANDDRLECLYHSGSLTCRSGWLEGYICGSAAFLMPDRALCTRRTLRSGAKTDWICKARETWVTDIVVEEDAATGSRLCMVDLGITVEYLLLVTCFACLGMSCICVAVCCLHLFPAVIYSRSTSNILTTNNTNTIIFGAGGIVSAQDTADGVDIESVRPRRVSPQRKPSRKSRCAPPGCQAPPWDGVTGAMQVLCLGEDGDDDSKRE